MPQTTGSAGASSRTRHAPYVPVLVFVVLATGIVIAGYLYYQNYRQHYRVEVERQLSAIAELKADELVDWRQERLGDASIFYKNAAFSALVRRSFQDPQDVEVQDHLRTWMGQFQARLSYDRVFLLDTHGVARIAVPDTPEPVAPHLVRDAAETLRSGKVTFLDFHRDAPDGPIHLAVLVPILDKQDADRPLGVLVLRIDPATYLYPFLNRWPTPSRTAETLIIRRDGDDALFLNELRFQKNTALALRAPLTRKEQPAVMAALGQQGIVEGVDYRGVPVIAAVRAVPDSPWFLVARMDTSEVYAPLRERLWLMIVLVGILLLAAGAGIGLVWRQQSVRFYREKSEVAQALRQSEEYLSITLHSIGDAVIATDTDGRVVRMNPVAEHLTGWPLAEAAGRALGEVFRITNARMGELVADPLAKALATGEVVALGNDTAMIARDGTQRQIADTAAPIRDAQGRIRGAVLVFYDVTTEYQVKKALRQSEERFRTLVESVTDYTYRVTVQDGRVVETTHGPGCLGVTGYPPEEFLADPELWFRISHPEDQAAVLDPAAKLSSGRKAPPLEHRIIHKNGEIRWVRNTPVPRYDERGQYTGYEGLIQDITEYRTMLDHFLQAQKMEAVGQLAGGVAHDFRNQLTVIKGYSEMLLRGKLVEGEGRKHIAEILQAVDRSANLTSQLLSFSRKQVLRPQVIDVNQLIGDMTKSMARMIAEDIRMSVVSAADAGHVKVDPGEFQQALVNLVLNARDAMPKGGQLRIETANVDLDEEFVRRNIGARPGPHVMVGVSDTGVGMDGETAKRIFEPFFTTKPVGQGAGLGLSMVYGFVQQAEGCITVQSQPDRGTTFRIYLPRVREDARPKSQETGPAPLARGQGTILVVEDEEAIRRMLVLTLAECGYTVLAAVDPAGAIQLANSHKGAIDLLMTDVVMPGMDGMDLAKRLRQAIPDLRVLFTSGYAGKALATHGLEAGRHELLTKPFTSRTVVEAVRRALRAVRP